MQGLRSDFRRMTSDRLNTRQGAMNLKIPDRRFLSGMACCD